MAYGLDSPRDWVMAPTDVGAATGVSPGVDEWAAMTGVPPTSPLFGGPMPDNFGSFSTPTRGYQRVVDQTAPPPNADRRTIARWNDWRELFDPHSPMLWLLLFALAAVSLIHVRLQGRAGPARASLGVG